LWLVPDQVVVMPISEKFNTYARKVADALAKKDIRVIVDDRNEKIGRKVRDNELKKIPYLLIVGEKEVANKEISIRKQGEGDAGSMKVTTFASQLNKEVEKQMNQINFK
jgi:threonyl-tRNA synthetase